MLANHRTSASTKALAKRGSSTTSRSTSCQKKVEKSSDVTKEEEASNSRKTSGTLPKKKSKELSPIETTTHVTGKTKSKVTTAVRASVAKDHKNHTVAPHPITTKKTLKSSRGSLSSPTSVLPRSNASTESAKDNLSKKQELVEPSPGTTAMEDSGRTATPNLPPSTTRSPVSGSLAFHNIPHGALSASDRDRRAKQMHATEQDDRLPYLHTAKHCASSSLAREEESARAEEEDEDEDNEEDEEAEEEEDEEDEEEEDEEDEEDDGEDEEEESDDEEEDDSDASDVDSQAVVARRKRKQSSRITVKVSREGDRNVKVLYIGKSMKFLRFKKDIMRRFSYAKLSDFDMYCIDADGDHVDIDIPQDFKNLTAKFWMAIEEDKLALEKAEKLSQLQSQSHQPQQMGRRFSARDSTHSVTPIRSPSEFSRTTVEYGDRSSTTVLRLYVRDSYKVRFEAKMRHARLESSGSLGTTKATGELPLPPLSVSDSNDSLSRQGALSSHFNMELTRNFDKTINFREDEEVLWTKMALLGKGSFGSVYEGITSDGAIMAVKVLEIPHNEDAEELHNVKREINLMRSLKHKNIVAYYGCQTKNLSSGQRQLEIFLEHCHGGSLASLRRKFERAKERFAISLVRAYTRQILEGLSYLHSMNVVHRDLKSDNVLISSFGEAKLADFGCSRRIGTALRDSAGGGGNEGFQTMVGTPLFMAPEVLSEKEGGYSKPADVWSVGCLLLELLGRVPWTFGANTNVFQIMFHISKSTGMPTGVPKTCPKSLYNFFENCFVHDQAKRATAEELLKHEWITCPDSKLEEVPGDTM